MCVYNETMSISATSNKHAKRMLDDIDDVYHFTQSYNVSRGSYTYHKSNSNPTPTVIIITRNIS